MHRKVAPTVYLHVDPVRGECAVLRYGLSLAAKDVAVSLWGPHYYFRVSVVFLPTFHPCLTRRVHSLPFSK